MSSHFWPLITTTITLTDFVFVIDERIPTTTTTIPFSDSSITTTEPSPATIDISEDHDRIPYQLFPFLGVFAIIGLIAVLLVLGFLGYRFYRSDQGLEKDYNGDHGSQNTSGNDGPREHEEQAVSSRKEEAHKVIIKSPILFGFIRKWRQHQQHPEQDPPIPSTFIPMSTSPMTLVPRWEVWRDPQRRRGVDALDLWEKKKKNAHGARPSSDTINLPQQESEQSTHVAQARKALEDTQFENKSED